MSIKLIKALLNKEFYDKYKHKLSKDFFIYDNNVKGLFNSLEKAYENINSDLTVDSLKELHYSYNPTITAANKKVLEGLFKDLSSLDLTKEVAEIVLKQAIEQNLWTELANIGIQGGDGLQADLGRVQEILDTIREGISLGDGIKEVSDNVRELLEQSENKSKWKFVLRTLRRKIEGIGPNTFTLIPARTNVGKTGLVTSFIFQPIISKNDDIGGFIHQGAKILYVGNEESVARTKLRGICCLSGYTEQELKEDENKEKEAQELFNQVRQNIKFIDAVGYSIEELTSYLKDNPIYDILVLDIIDKLSINGKTDNEAERLYKLYTACRELGKRFELAVIGTCQASVDAENRDIFGTDALANSKTGKGGELDLCLCLGRRLQDDGSDNSFRTINIAKNKLNSVDGSVTFFMDKDLCRIVA